MVKVSFMHIVFKNEESILIIISLLEVMKNTIFICIFKRLSGCKVMW